MKSFKFILLLIFKYVKKEKLRVFIN